MKATRIARLPRLRIIGLLLVLACAMPFARTQQVPAPAPAAAQSPQAIPAQPITTPDSGLPALAPVTAPILFPELGTVKRWTPADVILLDQTVFPVTASVGQFTPTQRAQATSRKLTQLLHDKAFDPATLTTADRESGTDILSGDLVVATVTVHDADFDALGRRC